MQFQLPVLSSSSSLRWSLSRSWQRLALILRPTTATIWPRPLAVAAGVAAAVAAASAIYNTAFQRRSHSRSGAGAEAEAEPPRRAKSRAVERAELVSCHFGLVCAPPPPAPPALLARKCCNKPTTAARNMFMKRKKFHCKQKRRACEGEGARRALSMRACNPAHTNTHSLSVGRACS